MPRPAKPWFRASANAWYVTLNGRKVSLGVSGRKSKREAVKAWHRLISNGPKPKPESKADATVKAVIDGFLADAEGSVSPGCLRNYRLFLLPFAQGNGSRPAEALTVAEAEAYSRRPEWSTSYRNGFIGSLVSAYRWAERGQVISRNPLAGIRKPPKASRGTKALVSADDHARLVAKADPLFGSFLRLLFLTGARPGEIASLRAEAVDYAQGVAVLTEHKTAHLGKSRVLFLCPEALDVLRRSDVNEGLFFPGEDGQRLTAQAIGRRLARLCVKAGVKPCMAYGYRHTFATDALAKACPMLRLLP
jgi:integrase